MGSIWNFYHPKAWGLIGVIGKVKLTNEDVVSVTIGFCDDCEASSDYTVYMLKTHYEKCISGHWNVRFDPYSEIKLHIYDESNHEIARYSDSIY